MNLYDSRMQYAQNFLTSAKFVRQLVQKAEISAADFVVEIGPGNGIITRELANVAGRVMAVEIDSRLVTELRSRFEGVDNIEILQKDILAFGWPTQPYQIFSNIPFNITAQILYSLLMTPHPPQDAHFIVQKEVADKFAVIRGSTESAALYGPWFEFNSKWDINRFEFRPVPSVDAALLQMRLRSQPLLDAKHKQLYYQFVTYGFRSWKKNLKIGFKSVFSYNQWKRLAKDGGFNVTALPSQLSLNQWVGLFNYFVVGVSPDKKRPVLDFDPQ